MTAIYTEFTGKYSIKVSVDTFTITDKQFVVDYNIADRYESAKSALVGSAIGGLNHPHYTESYYILANNVTNGEFK